MPSVVLAPWTWGPVSPVPFALEDWMTGRIVYPEVWWRHDSTGLRDPDLAEIEAALGIR